MTTEQPGPQGLDFGPVSVDSANAGRELSTLAILMAMLVAFKWVWKHTK